MILDSEDKSYKDDHAHVGEYTIDIDPDMNPCCIADITKHPLPIPDNSVVCVKFEGICLEYGKCQFALKEIKRIYNPNTWVSYLEINIKRPGTCRIDGYWQHPSGLNPFMSLTELGFGRRF